MEKYPLRNWPSIQYAVFLTQRLGRISKIVFGFWRLSRRAEETSRKAKSFPTRKLRSNWRIGFQNRLDRNCPAGSQEAALRGIRKVVTEVKTDMRSNGEEIPEPLVGKRYSGRFLIRMPPNLHRDLAIEAAESGVSLNRLASAKLSK